MVYLDLISRLAKDGEPAVKLVAASYVDII